MKNIEVKKMCEDFHSFNNNLETSFCQLLNVLKQYLAESSKMKCYFDFDENNNRGGYSNEIDFDEGEKIMIITLDNN